MPRITPLRRTMVRRVDQLVFEASPGGIRIRGVGKRRWHFVTWEQIASLAPETDPVLRLAEGAAGAKVLRAMGARSEDTNAEGESP